MIVNGIYGIAKYFHSCLTRIVSVVLEVVIYIICLPFVIVAIPVDILFPYDDDEDENN